MKSKLIAIGGLVVVASLLGGCSSAKPTPSPMGNLQHGTSASLEGLRSRCGATDPGSLGTPPPAQTYAAPTYSGDSHTIEIVRDASSDDTIWTVDDTGFVKVDSSHEAGQLLGCVALSRNGATVKCGPYVGGNIDGMMVELRQHSVYVWVIEQSSGRVIDRKTLNGPAVTEGACPEHVLNGQGLWGQAVPDQEISGYFRAFLHGPAKQ